MLPKLIVLCGLQCSGKTTYAKKLLNDETVVKFSSDDYRLEHPDWTNAQVFGQLYYDLNETLSRGLNCILDATSITLKARTQVFLNVKVPCEKIIHIFNTPYNECLRRLRERNASDYPHKVPEEVLERYYYSFEIPFYEEGWDVIDVENKICPNKTEEVVTTLTKAAEGFNQRNKHHTQDLGSHMSTVAKYLIQNKDRIVKDVRNTKTVHNVCCAGALHDVGKLFTQTIGEDGQAHYYNHANVGTYNLLCSIGMPERVSMNGWWEYSVDETLELLFYINYHMIMHNVKTEKSIKKWTRIFGEIKFANLKLVNEADCSNHVEGDSNE